MRILLWAPFGAGTHYWGPGTSAFRLYKSNKDKNVKITLIHGSNIQGEFPNVFYEKIQIGVLKKNSIISTLIYLVKSYRWISKNHHKYDVFHGITAYVYTFIPALFFRRFNKPTFIKLTGQHGGVGNNSLASKLTGFSRLRLQKANTLSGFISISSHITATLLENGIDKKKIYYIPNGVDTERFSPVKPENKVSLRNDMDVKNIFTVSYIGGLTKNKRVLELVKAIHKLAEDNYEIQLLIVGPDRSDGVVEEEIKEYIAKYNLQSSCIRIDHTAKPEFYFKISDVFALNSSFEGLSNSLLEAMASGLPCIASPASGTVDLIENGLTGFLTDGSPAQIAEKVSVLYKDNTLYVAMSKQAREKIIQGYSVDHVLGAHLKLFKEELDN